MSLDPTVLCAAVTGVCTVCCAAINAGMTRRAQNAEKAAQARETAQKASEDEAAMNKAGTLALLHDRLYQACNFYLGRGWITAEDLKNLEYMYEPYHAMGGNGTCRVLYERCEELEIRG